MSESLGAASKIRLGQLAEMLDQLANEEWPPDSWLEKQNEVQQEFDKLRRNAKQLLGKEDGDDLWEKTNPAITEESSRLQKRQVVESAIREAAKILRLYAA
jgi:hypothetical protein